LRQLRDQGVDETQKAKGGLNEGRFISKVQGMVGDLDLGAMQLDRQSV
jgi:hypothetical protein